MLSNANLLVQLAAEKRSPMIVPNIDKNVRQCIETLKCLPKSPYVGAVVVDKTRAAQRVHE